METIELRPGYTIPRLLKGNWQIAEDHSDREFDENELMEDLVTLPMRYDHLCLWRYLRRCGGKAW